MGKKVKRKTYVSKGERNAVSRATVNLLRRGRSELTRALNVIEAWRAGKNPWVTIPNPNKSETNRRFIKVHANSVYGDPRRTANIFRGGEPE